MHSWALRLGLLGTVWLAVALLTACGGGGDSGPPSSASPTVIPANLGITSPATAEAATTVTFSNSVGSLPGLKFQWDFGDGASSTEAAPTHAYTSGGEFDVVLKVTNEAGASRETSTKVSITNVANVRGLSCTGANSSGWCWQNPRPTGHWVNVIFFINATTGWRGGDNGEIFKTTDGGTTWVRQATGIAASVRGILFLDVTTGWATADSGAVLRTVDGGATWSVSMIPGIAAGIRDDLRVITAPDAQHVYIGRPKNNVPFNESAQVMYVSSDGGLSWRAARRIPHSITSDGKLWALDGSVVTASTDAGVSFSSVRDQAGYELVNSNGVWPIDTRRVAVLANTGVGSGKAIYTTVDGGLNWTRTRGEDELSQYLLRILDFSADGSTFVGCTNGSLIRSTDGGKTWSSVPGAPRLVDCRTGYVALGEGVIAGIAGLDTRLSTDGGITWAQPSFPGQTPLSVTNGASVRRLDASALTFSDGAGNSFLSFDNGRSWSAAFIAPRETYWSFAFSDAKNGVRFLLDGRALITKDGGLNWEGMSWNPGRVYEIQFVNRQTGWLVAGGDKLFKTTDAGKTWTAMPPPPKGMFSLGALSGVNFQNENVGFVRNNYSNSSSSGAFYASTRDGGNTWTKLALPTTVIALWQAEQAWVAVGSAGLACVSTDNGATWNTVQTGTLAHLTAVTFSDAKTAWAVGSGATLLRSDDAGGHWTSVPLPVAGSTLNAIKFVNAKVGWIVGSDGVLLATQDGGKTWRAQASGTSYPLYDIQAADANTAWVGMRGAILATGTGGN